MASTRRSTQHPVNEGLRFGSLPAVFPGRQPTLAPISTVEVSDADVGLVLDPVAQIRAEEFIVAALSFKERQARKSREVAVRTIRVALPLQLDELDEPDHNLDGLDAVDAPVRSRWSDEPLSTH